MCASCNMQWFVYLVSIFLSASVRPHGRLAELTALLEGGDRATIILSCGLGEARPALQGAGWGYPAICLSTDSLSQQFPVLAW